MLLFFVALLTFALGVVLLRALLPFVIGTGGVGAVAGGVGQKLLGLLVLLSVLFIVLLAVYRRRERGKRT